MKKFQLLCGVVIITLFSIQFATANSKTAQQTTTSGSIMRVNKAKIKSEFLKSMSNYIDFPSNSETPLLTSQDYEEQTWRPYGVDNFNEVAYTVMTRQKLEKAYPSDCLAAPIIATKGDFIIVFFVSESNDHIMSSAWLMTYDYDGNRIDSLEFVRQYYISDISGRLNQDLTIDQTFIDWGDPTFEFSEFWGEDTHEGTRFDIKYTITSSGHFLRTGCLRYEKKIYKADDLEVSDSFNPHIGIHAGKEKPIGVYTIKEDEDSKNKFPIYGHYTGTD